MEMMMELPIFLDIIGKSPQKISHICYLTPEVVMEFPNNSDTKYKQIFS